MLHMDKRSQRLVDVSHVVEHGMITYKGLPAPFICDYLSREASKEHYSEGVTFQIGKLEMVANTGTYLDSPFHRYADGKVSPNLHCRHWRIFQELCFARRQVFVRSDQSCLEVTRWPVRLC